MFQYEYSDCAHCGHPIRRLIADGAEWYHHDRDNQAVRSCAALVRNSELPFTAVATPSVISGPA